MGKDTQFVVISIASNGIVHAWGPYDSRREAINAKGRMKTQLKKDYPIEWYPEYHEPGAIRWSVCEVVSHRADHNKRGNK